MNILGICGSIRAASYNEKLLHAAAAEMSAATLTLHGIGGIPLYNSDLDGDEKPAAVQALIDAIAAADGLLIATPEYNYSVPGVLKNALDWASRPAYKSVLAGKPTAIVSAAMSPLGGARAQVHLRDVLAGTLTPVYAAPDYLLPLAQNAFADDGALQDAQAKERLARFVAGFIEWVGKAG